MATGSNKVRFTEDQLTRYRNDERRAMDPEDESSYQVELFIYDLSGGMAPVLSPALLGKQLDGIWHTGVVAYGREYFFGSAGIESCKPGGTVLGEPNKIENLGESQVPYQLFLEYIFGLGEGTYKPGAYDLLKHNCNNFSEELSQFLCGRGIPKDILQLPDEVLNTPLGLTLNEALKKIELKHANSRSINFGPLSNSLQIVRRSYEDPEFDELNAAIDQVRSRSVILEERRNSLNDKLSKKERKERRREKRERKEKRRKDRGESCSGEKTKKKNRPPLPPSSSQSNQSDFQSQSKDQSPDIQSAKEDSGKNSDSGIADTVNSIKLSDTPVAKEFVPCEDFWASAEDDCCGATNEEESLETQELEKVDPTEILEDTEEINPTESIEERVITPPPQYTDTPVNQSADMSDDAQEQAAAAPQQQPPAAQAAPIEDPEPEVEREPPIVFKDHTDVSKQQELCFFEGQSLSPMYLHDSLSPSSSFRSSQSSLDRSFHSCHRPLSYSSDSSSFNSLISSDNPSFSLKPTINKRNSTATKTGQVDENANIDSNFNINDEKVQLRNKPALRKDLTKNIREFLRRTSVDELNKRLSCQSLDGQDSLPSTPKARSRSPSHSIKIINKNALSNASDSIFKNSPDDNLSVNLDLMSRFNPKLAAANANESSLCNNRNRNNQTLKICGVSIPSPQNAIKPNYFGFVDKYGNAPWEKNVLRDLSKKSIRDQSSPVPKIRTVLPHLNYGPEEVGNKTRSVAPLKNSGNKQSNTKNVPTLIIRTNSKDIRAPERNSPKQPVIIKQNQPPKQTQPFMGNQNQPPKQTQPYIGKQDQPVKQTQPFMGRQNQPPVQNQQPTSKNNPTINQRDYVNLNSDNGIIQKPNNNRKNDGFLKDGIMLPEPTNRNVEIEAVRSRGVPNSMLLPPEDKTNVPPKKPPRFRNAADENYKFDPNDGVAPFTNKNKPDPNDGISPSTNKVKTEQFYIHPPEYYGRFSGDCPTPDTTDNNMTSDDYDTCDSESRASSAASLSRSDSASSTMSFGSSYYMLYVVDPINRPKTPEDQLLSPETSPTPDDPNQEVYESMADILHRNDSSSSVTSFKTISPEPEYFDENDRTFREIRGISDSSSDSTLKTHSYGSHSSKSYETLKTSSSGSSSSEQMELQGNQHSRNQDYHRRSFSGRSSPISRDDVVNISRASSLESLTSFLRRVPRAPSTCDTISTLDLAPPSPSSSSPSVIVKNSRPSPERPPSTDSIILFSTPEDDNRGSQEPLILYRPVPRYEADQAASPRPLPNTLYYLAPVRPNEEPMVYPDVLLQARKDFDELVGLCMHMLANEEQKHMEELRAYVVEDDGAWALGESFGDLFSRIFSDENIPEQARYHLVRILAVAALKDDVILLLHQDRRDHTIMNFANKVERLSPHLQEAVALFFCNMFEHVSPSEWLLYISEWAFDGGPDISNIRVTTKVAVNALLHANEKVQEYGTALMYNLGTKEVKTVVFDDVAPELAMAILQYLSTGPSEEYTWRTLTALCRFCYASSEVPSLIKMIGPDPNSFKGKSERIDVVIEELNTKTSRVRLF